MSPVVLHCLAADVGCLSPLFASTCSLQLPGDNTSGGRQHSYVLCTCTHGALAVCLHLDVELHHSAGLMAVLCGCIAQ